MLNWDEYDESKQQKVKEPSVPQEKIQVADTKEQEKEEVAIPSSVEAGERAKLAKEALQSLDTREGEEELEGQSGRVLVDDKAMINCRADLNQLVPFKYDWAWQKYLDGSANHWMPQEINMTGDIALWKSEEGLTEDERMIVMRLSLIHISEPTRPY